jgi:cytochrome c
MQRIPVLFARSGALLLASFGLVSSSTWAQGVPTAAAGATLFHSTCMACHSLDANRIGPMLRGVVGRKVASAAGYEYSDALKRVNGRWDAPRLEKWLQDPQSVATGTKMAFSLPSAADRKAVFQFLASSGAATGAAKQ